MGDKKKFGETALGGMGLGLLESAIGGGMGMLLGKANDARQLKQEQKGKG